MKTDNPDRSFRFLVALSFPGEYREYVRKCDEELSKFVRPEKIFFDERFEAEIAGFDADTILQRIYHEQSELIVVFLCKEYEQKEWCCHVEWRAIRDLIKKRRGRNILPLRFDNSEIPGIYSIDICPDISNRSPQQTSQLIWNRLQILRGEETSETERIATLRLVPDLPEQYVLRETLLSKIKHSLLKSESPVGLVGISPHKEIGGIVGMGGVGKTVLASALVRDREVRQKFPDGIFWICLGRENVNVLNRQIQLARMLGEPNPTYRDEQDAKAGLEDLLRNKRCLVVLDDVWNITHAQAFDLLESESRLLITSRNADILHGLQGEAFQIDILQENESLSLLAEWARCKPEDLPETARTIARECGNLPLAVAIVGSIAGERSHNWEHILDKLHKADLRQLKQPFPSALYPYSSVFNALDVSLDMLSAEERERYVDFAVFPEDTFIPEKVLLTFWTPLGLDAIDIQQLIQRLAMRSLLQVRADGSVLLHDLHRDFVRLKCEDPQELQNRFLEAYRNRFPDGWHTVSDDGYLYEHAALHFIEAGKRNDLRKLLLDTRWLRAKLKVCEVSSLLYDINEFDLTVDNSLEVLSDVFKKSSHVINRDADQLISQLHGRLLDLQSEEIQEFLVRARETNDSVWLLPLWCCLASSESRLIKTLVGHTRPISAVAITHDGRYAATGSMASSCAPGMHEEGGGRMRVWDLEAGKQMEILDSESFSTRELFISERATRIASSGQCWITEPGFSGKSGAPIFEYWDLTERRKKPSIRGRAWTSGGEQFGFNSDYIVVQGENDLSLLYLQTGDINHLPNDLFSNGVRAITISRDGRYAATLDKVSWLRIFDIQSRRELNAKGLGFNSYFGKIMSTDDLELGVIALVQGYYPLLSTALTYKLRSLEQLAVLEDAEKDFILAWGRLFDGEYYVFGTQSDYNGPDRPDPTFDIKVWKFKTGKLCRRLKGHQGWVKRFAVSCNGDFAVSASEDKTLIVWNLREGEVTRRLRGHTAHVNDIAMSADSSRLLSGSSDRTIRVWDLAGLEKKSDGKNRETHGAAINAIAATADGLIAASGSADALVKTWDLRNGNVISTFDSHSTYVNAIAINRGGNLVVSAGICTDIRVWELESSRLLKTISLPEGSWYLDNYVNAIAFTQDEKAFLCGLSNGRIYLVDLANGEIIYEVLAHRHVNSISVSRESNIAVSGGDEYNKPSWPLKVWDVETGKELLSLRGHSGPINDVAVTGDGRYAISGSADRCVNVWDLHGGALLYTIKEHEDDVKAVAITPDNHLAIAGSHSGVITVWEISSAAVLARFTGDAFIGSITALNDNETIVIGDGLGKLYCLLLRGYVSHKTKCALK